MAMTIAERMRRFNSTTGVFGYMSKDGPAGGHSHPDRCVCNATDSTPHKHYDKPPFRCARCRECEGYTPALAETEA